MHKVPIIIGLGHELIHALREMDGEKYSKNKTQKGPRLKTWPVESDVSIEELITVGLKGHTKGITENKLREEHGYRKRIAY